MSNHTPGPWVVRAGDWADNGNARYELEGIKHVSAVDARLIAAAPDLLAICKELAESAEYWSEYDVPLGIVGRLGAAISKVEEACKK